MVARVLVIEDEQNLRFAIKRTLTKSGLEVTEASCLKHARAAVAQTEFDLVLTDVMLGSESGMDLVREMRAEGYDGAIVVMTAFGTVENAVAAMKDGADDYLQKPLSLEELSLQVDKWLEHRRLARRVKLYERLERTREQSTDLLGQSAAWRQTLSLADRLARIPVTQPGGEAGASLPCILLLGETGVGKGVLARHIHARACEAAETGERGAASKGGSAPPFVHVNCSALPATLVEAELFGHEKGAFTDAREPRPGLFEMADGGTIFLDEISEMPLELQAKLLLVVEQGTYRRVGGTKERTVRVRVIAASNQDLAARSAAGQFRRDLLYRLNAFTILIPPLRERNGDALLIADALLGRLSRRYGRPAMRLGAAAKEAISAHDWPGNVRELVNGVQRAVMLCDGTEIAPEDLALLAMPAAHAGEAQPTAVVSGATPHAGAGGSTNGHHPAAGAAGGLVFDFDSGPHTADEVERSLIIQALQRTGGNVSRAAKLIGMQRSSLRYRMERYKLDAFAQEVSGR